MIYLYLLISSCVTQLTQPHLIPANSIPQQNIRKRIVKPRDFVDKQNKESLHDENTDQL